MQMQMTEGEIVRSFKAAKHKANQINILADLNCTNKDKIKEILRNNGIALHGIPNEGVNVGARAQKKPAVENKEFNKAMADMTKGTEFETMFDVKTEAAAEPTVIHISESARHESDTAPDRPTERTERSDGVGEAKLKRVKTPELLIIAAKERIEACNKEADELTCEIARIETKREQVYYEVNELELWLKFSESVAEGVAE